MVHDVANSFIKIQFETNQFHSNKQIPLITNHKRLLFEKKTTKFSNVDQVLTLVNRWLLVNFDQGQTNLALILILKTHILILILGFTIHLDLWLASCTNSMACCLCLFHVHITCKKGIKRWAEHEQIRGNVMMHKNTYGRIPSKQCIPKPQLVHRTIRLKFSTVQKGITWM